MARGRHAHFATGAFGGAPTGPRSSCGVCRRGPRPPCALRYWRLRWSSHGATALARAMMMTMM
eukprot:636916-Pyramimonas_sp.AAC.1